MDKRFTGLIFLFLLSFILFITLVVFNKQITTKLRAREETDPSVSKSLILAWPLNLSADSKSESVIQVVVRNAKGGKVANRVVNLTTTLGTLKETSVNAGASGIAEFHLTSDKPGLALIKATVDSNVPLTRQVTINFQ